MNNQLKQKAMALSQQLAANKLIKEATQQITHKSVLSQNNLGKEQSTDLHEGQEGVLADTPAAKNTSHEDVQNIPNCQDLNKSPEAAMASTGTEVNTMTGDGNVTGTPAEQAKTASYYKTQLAGMINSIRKQASAQPQDIVTGSETFAKFASLDARSTQRDMLDAQETLQKLASTNPVFNTIRERILMQKMAAEVEELAAAEGIPAEQAAEIMDEAAAANPEMKQEVEDEATGEAIADLAEAENASADFQAGLQQLAYNASMNLGVEVTPEDIAAAAEQTVNDAEALGVEPEELIEAALEQINAGDPAEQGIEPSPEDEANAEAILEEAAANGISPEEVIQMAAEELDGGEVPEDMPVAEAPAEEMVGEEKTASVHMSPRVAYVSAMLHQ